MTDTFDYITRFVVIVFGYCVAVLAAGFFLAAILYSQIDVLGYALSDPFFQDVFTEIRDAWDMTGFTQRFSLAAPCLPLWQVVSAFPSACADYRQRSQRLEIFIALLHWRSGDRVAGNGNRITFLDP